MGRRRRWGGGAGAVVALGALLALPALAAKDDLDLVSRANDGAAADGASSASSVSGDGRIVAFTSDADNLAGSQFSDSPDVFFRDIDAAGTALVSRATGAGGTPGDAGSFDPSISADGRRVAFSSEAGNLSDLDARFTDVYVRDVGSGTTTLVSRPDGLTSPGADGVSNEPSISPDGGYVAFVSDADGLSDDAVEGVANVYVRDLGAGTTRLASRAPDGSGASASSSAPSISADGRYVVFLSSAANLSTEDAPGVRGVFVRDLVAGTTTLASRATGAAGEPAVGLSLSPSISADGTRVAFASSSPNLSDEDSDSVTDVFVRDLAAQTTTLASRATGAAGPAGDSGAFDSVLSGDGQHVAFRSAASNLSTEDLDPAVDVFARDLAAATTTLVSRAAGAAGPAAAAASGEPSISASGRFVTFSSGAANLSGLDLDPEGDVFRRDVAGLPAPTAAPPPPSPPATALAASGPVRATALRCAGLKVTIAGTRRADTLRGTRGRDVIAGLGGDDLVFGFGGNDVICLGAGNDHARAGAGADVIRGGPGRDVLMGGPGPDLLDGGDARDTASGGAGWDICRAEVRPSC